MHISGQENKLEQMTHLWIQDPHNVPRMSRGEAPKMDEGWQQDPRCTQLRRVCWWVLSTTVDVHTKSYENIESVTESLLGTQRITKSSKQQPVSELNLQDKSVVQVKVLGTYDSGVLNPKWDIATNPLTAHRMSRKMGRENVRAGRWRRMLGNRVSQTLWTEMWLSA